MIPPAASEAQATPPQAEYSCAVEAGAGGKGRGVRIFPEMVQGSEEWLTARCGLLTASEIKLIVTPTLKIASNDKERAHLYELLAQRITGYVEPRYISDDMLRGKEDEIAARIREMTAAAIGEASWEAAKAEFQKHFMALPKPLANELEQALNDKRAELGG